MKYVRALAIPIGILCSFILSYASLCAATEILAKTKIPYSILFPAFPYANNFVTTAIAAYIVGCIKKLLSYGDCVIVGICTLCLQVIGFILLSCPPMLDGGQMLIDMVITIPGALFGGLVFRHTYRASKAD